MPRKIGAGRRSISPTADETPEHKSPILDVSDKTCLIASVSSPEPEPVSLPEAKDGIPYSVRRTDGFNLFRWSWRVYPTSDKPPLEGLALTNHLAKARAKQVATLVRTRGERPFRRQVWMRRGAAGIVALLVVSLVAVKPDLFGRAGMAVAGVAIGAMDTAGGVVFGVTDGLTTKITGKKKGKRGKKSKKAKGGAKSGKK